MLDLAMLAIIISCFVLLIMLVGWCDRQVNMEE